MDKKRRRYWGGRQQPWPPQRQQRKKRRRWLALLDRPPRWGVGSKRRRKRNNKVDWGAPGLVRAMGVQGGGGLNDGGEANRANWRMKVKRAARTMAVAASSTFSAGLWIDRSDASSACGCRSNSADTSSWIGSIHSFFQDLSFLFLRSVHWCCKKCMKKKK